MHRLLCLERERIKSLPCYPAVGIGQRARTSRRNAGSVDADLAEYVTPSARNANVFQNGSCLGA